MKIILFIITLTVLVNSTVHAQEKMSVANKAIIPVSKIGSKTVNNRTIQTVKLTDLKTGYNYMTLKSGDILFVEIANSQLKSVTMTNSKGLVLGKPITIKPGTTAFQCSQNFCICYGDGDCNDMFTTNVCGPNAVCFGNNCVCYR
jgi:hypothetical protein